MKNLTLHTAGALCALALTAQAQLVTTEDFESGDGGWMAGPFAPPQVLETSGGNPGQWLHCTGSGNNPEWYSPSTAAYSGDFRARGVTSASCDLRQDVEFGQFTVWLMLVRDPNPMMDFDEEFAFGPADGGLISPPAGAGWINYNFTIPSQETTLPAGWNTFFGDWDTIIQDVTSVQVHFANNPVIGFDLLVPPPGWDFGIDNFSITESFSFATSCNGDGGDQMGCTPCPCGNEAAVGTVGGCVNSASQSAALMVSGGSPSASASDISFSMTGGNVSTFGVLTSGDNLLPNMGPCAPGSGIVSIGVAALDGLRCVGGNFLRHGSRATDMNGDIGITNNGWGPPAGPMGGIAASSGFVAGQTRHFQVFYRELDTLVCQTGQNTSNAVTVDFTL